MITKSKELKHLIETAESFEHTDMPIYLETGRDGESELVPVKISIKKLNSGIDEEFALIITETN